MPAKRPPGRPARAWPTDQEISNMPRRTFYLFIKSREREIRRQRKLKEEGGRTLFDVDVVDARYKALLGGDNKKYAGGQAERIVGGLRDERKPSGRPVRPVVPNPKYADPAGDAAAEAAPRKTPLKSKHQATPMAKLIGEALPAARAKAAAAAASQAAGPSASGFALPPSTTAAPTRFPPPTTTAAPVVSPPSPPATAAAAIVPPPPLAGVAAGAGSQAAPVPGLVPPGIVAPGPGAGGAAAGGDDLADALAAADAAHPDLQDLRVLPKEFDRIYAKTPGQPKDDAGAEMTMYKVTSADDKLIYARMESKEPLSKETVAAFELYARAHATHPMGIHGLKHWTLSGTHMLFATLHCPDGDLSNYVKNQYGGKGAPVQFGVELLRQLLVSVDKLEELNIRHQDLKPQNVLWFGQDERAAIIDPGMLQIVGTERDDDATVPLFDHEAEYHDSGVRGTHGFMSPLAFYRSDHLGSDRDGAAMTAVAVVLGRLPFSFEMNRATNYWKEQGNLPGSAEEYMLGVIELFNRAGVLPWLFDRLKLKPEYSDFIWIIQELTWFHESERLPLKVLLSYPLFTNSPNLSITEIHFEQFASGNGPLTFTLTLGGRPPQQLGLEAPGDLNAAFADKFPSVDVGEDVSERIGDLFRLAELMKHREKDKRLRNFGERNQKILVQRHHVLNWLFEREFIKKEVYDRLRLEDYGEDALKKAEETEKAFVAKAAEAAAATAAGDRKKAGQEGVESGYEDDDVGFIPMYFYASLETRLRYYVPSEEDEADLLAAKEKGWISDSDDEDEEDAGSDVEMASSGEEGEMAPASSEESETEAAAGSSAGVRRDHGDRPSGASPLPKRHCKEEDVPSCHRS